MGPDPPPHHLITPLLSREGFLCLLNPESDDPAMIREAGEWSLVNDSQFPAPHSLSSFSPQIPDTEISDLVSCRNPSILPSIKRTLTRSLSGLCQNKQLEHWLATCIVNIWGNQTSGKNESWSLVIDVSAGGRGADGIWYAASSSPLLAAIVSCANVEISENKKRRVLQCQYWRQPAQSNETGKLREGRQNGKGDLKIHSFVSWKLDMRSKIVFNLNSNRWIFTMIIFRTFI